MTFLAIVIVGLIIYYFYSQSTSSNSNKSNNSKSDYYNSSPKIALSFLPPIPKDYQIYVSNMTVAGISFRKNDALRFMKATEQTLELERELNNPHDRNAIKVIGVIPSNRYFLGYVPKGVSEQVISTGMLDKVAPRLARAFQGNQDYFEIQFQIIGLKVLKKDFDAFFENQPAEVSHKDYYKFFNLPIPKGLTTGVALQQIAEHRAKLEIEDKAQLQEFDAYNDILDEFDDNDFRETYEVKKPSRAVLNDALSQLKAGGKTYDYLSSNMDEVVDRIIKIRPDLERVT